MKIFNVYAISDGNDDTLMNVAEEPDIQPSTSNDQPEQVSSDYADTLVNVAEEPDIQPSTSNDQPEQVSSDYADTLLQISPLPKAVVVPGARKRKATGSEVITSSPYKNALVEKKLENKKTVRKTAKGKKVTAKVSTQRDTTPCGTCGVRFCDDEAARSRIQCQLCGIWHHNECQGLDDRGPITFECILCENAE